MLKESLGLLLNKLTKKYYIFSLKIILYLSQNRKRFCGWL